MFARLGAKDDIVFVTSNRGFAESRSTDIDVYCVIRSGCSRIEMFEDHEGTWVEFFIDTLADLRAKIANMDEIAINFILEMPFVDGDRSAFDAIHAEVSELIRQYRLPPERRNLLKYRVKVLLSKYLNPEPGAGAAQTHFLLNAMSYPLVQLALEEHGIFPSSPRRWLSQMRDAMPVEAFEALARFLAHAATHDEVITLCDRYVGTLNPIRIDKPYPLNRITFLG
ncbi:MAG TPA: hypothetical protein VGC35_06015 [Allosphingosinicella sp.]